MLGMQTTMFAQSAKFCEADFGGHGVGCGHHPALQRVQQGLQNALIVESLPVFNHLYFDGRLAL
ncbi:hypothetical protein [Peribacillus sp. SCS-37]|uniref:hypothetical protein n=1 Tax=Paraperibacillus esterisolvens TaxID=3115296 RepID=UPI003905BAB1